MTRNSSCSHMKQILITKILDQIQIIVHSTSQNSSPWWSSSIWGVRRGSVWNPVFHQPALYHVVLRWKKLWGKRQGSVWNPLFHQSTQYHVVLRWKTHEERGRARVWEPSFPPINTVPYGAQMENSWGKRQGSVWNPLFHQSTQYHMVLRWKTLSDCWFFFFSQYII